MCQAQQHECWHCIRKGHCVFGNMPDSERLEHREMVRVGGDEGLGEGEC